MTFQYSKPEDQVLALLAARGPLLSRRKLLGLLRHNHRLAGLIPILDLLAEQGLVKHYQRKVQGPHRWRNQHVVEITENGQLEVALG